MTQDLKQLMFDAAEKRKIAKDLLFKALQTNDTNAHLAWYTADTKASRATVNYLNAKRMQETT